MPSSAKWGEMARHCTAELGSPWPDSRHARPALRERKSPPPSVPAKTTSSWAKSGEKQSETTLRLSSPKLAAFQVRPRSLDLRMPSCSVHAKTMPSAAKLGEATRPVMVPISRQSDKVSQVSPPSIERYTHPIREAASPSRRSCIGARTTAWINQSGRSASTRCHRRPPSVER